MPQYRLNGKVVTRRQFFAGTKKRGPVPVEAGAPGHHTTWTKPKMSDALGVHPNQIADAQALLHDAGTHAEFDPESGCCEVKSLAHQRQITRAFGYIDYDGGYGDTYNNVTRDKDPEFYDGD